MAQGFHRDFVVLGNGFGFQEFEKFSTLHRMVRRADAHKARPIELTFVPKFRGVFPGRRSGA